MPSDNYETYASSTIDFYELLGLTPEATQKDIDKARRRTLFKYHPDKVGGKAIEQFHLSEKGCQLLSDPATRAIYDNNRAARLHRVHQDQLIEGERKQRIDDLQARERKTKRPREQEEEDDEEKLEREIRRLAGDGRVKRLERDEVLRRQPQLSSSSAPPGSEKPPINSATSDIDRTIKVRWGTKGSNPPLTSDDLKTIFAKFGEVEHIALLASKPTPRGTPAKPTSSCLVVFVSIVGAFTAVEAFRKRQGSEMQLFDGVKWAASKEPHVLSRPVEGKQALRSKLSDSINRSGNTPNVNANATENKRPSFASFSASATTTPKRSPFSDSTGPNSPSLEEITMIRLKRLELARLAAEIKD